MNVVVPRISNGDVPVETATCSIIKNAASTGWWRFNVTSIIVVQLKHTESAAIHPWKSAATSVKVPQKTNVVIAESLFHR
ncbi:MAG: hypothetical protein R2847_11225 [Bacteroidia bacterium]